MAMGNGVGKDLPDKKVGKKRAKKKPVTPVKKKPTPPVKKKPANPVKRKKK